MVRSTLVAAAPNPAPVTSTGTLALAGSLLATTSEAEAAPVTDGEYRTVTSTDLPLATVNGVAGETILNTPAPPPIGETTRSMPPTLLTVNFESLVCPMGMLPKSSEAGAMAIDGCALIELLPASVMVTLSLTGSLVLRISELDACPEATGAKRTVTSVEAPAATVK